MNYSYKFDPKKLAKETANIPAAGFFTSWNRVVRLLAERHFNIWEAEALIKSNVLKLAVKGVSATKVATSGTLASYFDNHGIAPGSKFVNDLVMKTFAKEYDLELNEKGQPCRRGTMPGNYHPNRTILVPLGTPACCDPTSETYWSM
jgi:hypothetical protein